jgi:hypothetical protein
LAGRGHPLLADGALPVRLDGGPVGEIADDAVQLWPDAVGQLGLDADRGEVIRPALAKRRYRFDIVAAAPLGAVAVLHDRANAADALAQPVRGQAAAQAIVRYTAMRPVVAALGGTTDHFRWATALATVAGVVQLPGPRNQRDLAAVVDAVEALAAAGRRSPAAAP